MVSMGYFLGVVLGLLIAVASLIVEYELLGMKATVVTASGHSSWSFPGSRAVVTVVVHELCCSG